MDLIVHMTVSLTAELPSTPLLTAYMYGAMLGGQLGYMSARLLTTLVYLPLVRGCNQR